MVYLPSIDNQVAAENWGLPTLNAAFLAQPDVLLLGPDDYTTWPVQARQPMTYGIRYILLQPGDYTGWDDVNYLDRYMPFEGGNSGAPVYVIGLRSTADQDLNTIGNPAGLTDSAVARLGTTYCVGSGAPYAVSHLYFFGVRFKGQIQISANAQSIRLHRCEFDNVAAQPIRLRGTNAAVISECYIHREPPYPTTADRIGVQLGDNVNDFAEIKYSTIIGYTDAIQTTNVTNNPTTPPGTSDTYGYAEGLRIHGCTLGFLPKHQSADGSELLEGGENLLDCKTGGTAVNPIKVTGCILFGTRPNSRTPGYALTVHIVADHIDISDCVFSDCESVVFLNAQYVNNGGAGNGWHPLNLTIANNLISRCLSHGSAYYASQQGMVWSGSHTMVFIGNDIINVDQLCAQLPDAAAEAVQAMAISGNRWFGGTNYGASYADEGAWLADGNTVATAPTLMVRYGVPYTDETISIEIPEPTEWLKFASQVAGETARDAINTEIANVLTAEGYTLANGDADVIAKKSGVDTAYTQAVPQAVLLQDSGTGFWVRNPQRAYARHFFIRRSQWRQLLGGVTPVATAQDAVPDQQNPI